MLSLVWLTFTGFLRDGKEKAEPNKISFTKNIRCMTSVQKLSFKKIPAKLSVYLASCRKCELCITFFCFLIVSSNNVSAKFVGLKFDEITMSVTNSSAPADAKTSD